MAKKSQKVSGREKGARADVGEGTRASPVSQPTHECAHFRLVINWHWVEPLQPYDYFDLQVRDSTGTVYVLSPNFDDQIDVVQRILAKIAQAWPDKKWSFTAGSDRVITG
jgi:hypothetical protein